MVRRNEYSYEINGLDLYVLKTTFDRDVLFSVKPLLKLNNAGQAKIGKFKIKISELRRIETMNQPWGITDELPAFSFVNMHY